MSDDIDDMDFDPADFDPRSAGQGSSAMTVAPAVTPAVAAPPSVVPTPSAMLDKEKFKDWQIVYPVYFDASKSRADGRRVSKSLAVQNPLAYTILTACRQLGIHSVYEPQKTHPKDWSNPGRVRVLFRDEHNKGVSPVALKVNNKRHLYQYLAEYMQKHPTTAQTPFESTLKRHMESAGHPIPEKTEPLAVPRGWKISSVLPLNSPAVSAGAMDDNMLQQMQQQMFPGLNAPALPEMKVPAKPKMKVVRR